jgi:hypothetical protein
LNFNQDFSVKNLSSGSSLGKIFPADISKHGTYPENADGASVIKLIFRKIVASKVDGNNEFVKKTMVITSQELCLKVQLLCDS